MRRWQMALLGALLGASSVFAVCGDPWDCPYLCCCWCGSFEATGEFLYVRPETCDENFAILDNRPFDLANNFGEQRLPVGQQRNNHLGYKTGFRVGLGYLFEGRCDDFQVAFTGFWPTERRRLSAPRGGGIWATVGHPRYLRQRLNNPIGPPGMVVGVKTLAEARTRLGYETVQADFGKRIALQCGLWLRGFVGGRWVRIRDRRDYLFAGTAAVETLGGTIFQDQLHLILARNESEGAGPSFGSEFRYTLGCGLGISGKGSVSVLLGQRKARLSQISRGITVPSPGPEDFDETLEVSTRHTGFGFTQCDLRLGLSYLGCCGRCYSLLVTVGYELVSYPNGLAQARFDHTGGTDRQVCQSFDYHGLFISFRLAL